MRIKEILERIKKENPQEIDFAAFAEEFNEVFFYTFWKDLEEFVCYSIAETLCTDTVVGGLVYYLHGEPVAISWQNFRKSDKVISWLSMEAFNKTHAFFLELRRVEEKLQPWNLVDSEDENIYDVFKIRDATRFKWNLNEKAHE